MINIHNALEARGFRLNGGGREDLLNTLVLDHWVKDLKKGYIYLWVDEKARHFSFRYSPAAMVGGELKTFKKPETFLLRLDELMEKIPSKIQAG